MRTKASSALLAATLAVAALGTAGAARAEETYRVDPSHSTVVFGVEHLGVSRFYGRFDKVVGEIVLAEAGKHDKGTVVIEIDAASVSTANEKRDKHLRSPDFFNTKQFPKIAFKSTAVSPSASGDLEVEGELTLLGKTQKVKAKGRHIGAGKDPWGSFRTGYEMRFTIRRSEFGMTYMLDGLGDEVELIVSIEAVKQ